MMQDEAVQTDIGGSNVTKNKLLTSNDIQTDLSGDEVERLREFHDKYLEKQLKLGDNLR